MSTTVQFTAQEISTIKVALDEYVSALIAAKDSVPNSKVLEKVGLTTVILHKLSQPDTSNGTH